jgi:hypothetical protein
VIVSAALDRATESGLVRLAAVESRRFCLNPPTTTAPLKSPTTIGMRFIVTAAWITRGELCVIEGERRAKCTGNPRAYCQAVRATSIVR